MWARGLCPSATAKSASASLTRGSAVNTPTSQRLLLPAHHRTRPSSRGARARPDARPGSDRYRHPGARDPRDGLVRWRRSMPDIEALQTTATSFASVAYSSSVYRRHQTRGGRSGCCTAGISIGVADPRLDFAFAIGSRTWVAVRLRVKPLPVTPGWPRASRTP